MLWNGSGISWTICKQSAPCCRQMTTPTPHHSFLQAGCSSWRPANSVKTLKVRVRKLGLSAGAELLPSMEIFGGQVSGRVNVVHWLRQLHRVTWQQQQAGSERWVSFIQHDSRQFTAPRHASSATLRRMRPHQSLCSVGVLSLVRAASGYIETNTRESRRIMNAWSV